MTTPWLKWHHFLKPVFLPCWPGVWFGFTQAKDKAPKQHPGWPWRLTLIHATQTAASEYQRTPFLWFSPPAPKHTTSHSPSWDNPEPQRWHPQTHARCTPWRPGCACCSPGRRVPPAPRDPGSSIAGLPAAAPGPWSPPRARLLRGTRSPGPQCGSTCKPRNCWLEVTEAAHDDDDDDDDDDGDDPEVQEHRGRGGLGPYYSCLSRRQCITVMSLKMTEETAYLATPERILWFNKSDTWRNIFAAVFTFIFQWFSEGGRERERERKNK